MRRSLKVLLSLAMGGALTVPATAQSGPIKVTTLAGSATFALGKAFCFYYAAVHKGHVPDTEALKGYYREQLAQAQKLWSGT